MRAECRHERHSLVRLNYLILVWLIKLKMLAVGYDKLILRFLVAPKHFSGTLKSQFAVRFHGAVKGFDFGSWRKSATKSVVAS
jgi:hypothetical protein